MTSSSPTSGDSFSAEQRCAQRELASQLRSFPAFRALLRSVEAALVSSAAPLPTPVLDLGSGDGDFGGRALSDNCTLGIDLHLASLAEARGRYPKRSYCAASATNLPLASGSLGSVVANSVLEHIPDLASALDECARLLRPGGHLVITAPCHRFQSHLLVSRTLTRLRMTRLAKGYETWFNRHSLHFHLLSAEEWQTKLENRSFRVLHKRYYFSPRAHATFDLLHYLGLPALALRHLTGRWLPWRNPLSYRLALRWLGPLASPAADENGAYVFLIAKREV